MPRPRLLNVHLQRNPSGLIKYYYREGHGPRTRLPDNPASPDFKAAYRTLFAGGEIAPVGRGRGAPSKFKVAGLIALYKASPVWQTGALNTRKQRELFLRQIEAKHGDEDTADVFHKSAIIAGMDARPWGSANLFLFAVKGLLNWAIEAGHVEGPSPADGIKTRQRPQSADPDEEVGHTTWTEEDVAKFQAAYPLGTRERLAFDVFLYTGLRLGDAVRLGQAHVGEDNIIQIRTEKRNTVAVFEFAPELKASIAAQPVVGAAVFICGERGRPILKGSLGAWFIGRCKAIGLDGLTPHGLRKRAACRMAEDGATLPELQGKFAWSDPKIAMHYIHEAAKVQLAKTLAAKSRARTRARTEEADKGNVVSLTLKAMRE